MQRKGLGRIVCLDRAGDHIHSPPGLSIATLYYGLQRAGKAGDMELDDSSRSSTKGGQSQSGFEESRASGRDYYSVYEVALDGEGRDEDERAYRGSIFATRDQAIEIARILYRVGSYEGEGAVELVREVSTNGSRLVYRVSAQGLEERSEQ